MKESQTKSRKDWIILIYQISKDGSFKEHHTKIQTLETYSIKYIISGNVFIDLSLSMNAI